MMMMMMMISNCWKDLTNSKTAVLIIWTPHIKIVKYCYPLIVFGLTDIMRQCIPVAFMFTTHETTDDYNYFFESLKIVCERLEIDLSPEFFALDASKAMANAV